MYQKVTSVYNKASYQNVNLFLTVGGIQTILTSQYLEHALSQDTQPFILTLMRENFA